MSKASLGLAFGIVIMAIISRFIPHPANWTALGALALWSSSLFRDRTVAWILPLAVLFLTDLVLGFYPNIIWTYAALAAMTAVGTLIKPEIAVWRFAVGSLAASLLFFLISNFGVWASSGLYSRDIFGLERCFLAAVPFFSNQVAGDLLYGAVVAGSFAIFMRFNKLAAVTCSTGAKSDS